MDKSIYQQIQDWHELLKEGIISEAEFFEKKQLLLGGHHDKKQSILIEPNISRTDEEQSKIDADYELLFNNRSWFQKNKGLLIGVSIFIIAGLVIGYFATNKSDSIATVLENVSNAYYYTNGDNLNHVSFYRKPDSTTKKSAFFDTRETVFVQKIENGFGYVEFTNNMGQNSKGWLKMQDLQYCPDCRK